MRVTKMYTWLNSVDLEFWIKLEFRQTGEKVKPLEQGQEPKTKLPTHAVNRGHTVVVMGGALTTVQTLLP